MFEDIFDDVVVVNRTEAEEKVVTYHVMKTVWDNGSIDMKESYVSGEHIAEGLDRLFKNLGLPIKMEFNMIKIKDGEDKWSFCLTIEGDKKEG